jgi:hypothetical protein
MAEELERIAQDKTLPTPAEQADNLIRYLGDLGKPGSRTEIEDAHQGGVVGAINASGLMFVLQGLMAQGLLAKHPMTTERTGYGILTLAGWARYEELKRGDVGSTYAFMAMPFGEPSIQHMLDACFRPAVAATGYSLEKLNDRPKAGLIDDRLRVAIQSCRFLIADVTHQNRGAYWESGYAEGLGKPVIYTCEASAFEKGKNSEGVHFDTNHHLHVLWEVDKLNEAAEELKATIRATIPEAKREDKPAI